MFLCKVPRRAGILGCSALGPLVFRDGDLGKDGMVLRSITPRSYWELLQGCLFGAVCGLPLSTYEVVDLRGQLSESEGCQLPVVGPVPRVEHREGVNR